MLAAGGYQHIRMFDLTSGNLNPVVNYEGISKNIMTVGFQVGTWIYKYFGGVKIQDLRKMVDGCIQEVKTVQQGSGI